MSVRDDISSIFGADGRLAKHLRGYEPRPQQVQMAEAVADAFDEGRRVMVEAATGTGKTVAYLVPAILSRRTTIISTATKTLQDQIVLKDLPLLHDVVPRNFTAVYLKGRQNYLCRWQYEAFRTDPQWRRPEDRHWWPAVEKWAATTQTGDRAEIPDLPDDWPTWSSLSIGADACLGRDCEHYHECHVVRARAQAAEADIVVVNHHLFFADLALRTRDNAELLPPYEAVVFDEAHHLEEIASGYFGLQVSTWRFLDLLGDVLRFLEREKKLEPLVTTAVADVRDRVRAFFLRAADAAGAGDDRWEWAPVMDGDAAGPIRAAWQELDGRLTGLRDRIEALEGGEVGQRLVDRIETLQTETSALVERDDDGMVYVIERRGRGVFLMAHPIDISDVLKALLYRTCRTQVFTSATLTTDGDFRFFRHRMGLPEDTVGEVLEPVFDYMRQALLYVPDDLPEPNDPLFVEKIAPTMQRLIETTDGRAFVLFTSYRNMNRAYELIAPKLAHTALIQGQKARNALLEDFRSDTHSVLFATSSFWEGVDVQGEALSLVIIDKLPFASPFDPLVRARLRHIEERGGNPFVEYQVPSAAIALKQGFGRLIRHRDDTGIIAVMDSRVVRRSYGRRFLESLPRARRTQDLELVTRWWQAVSARRDGPETESAT